MCRVIGVSRSGYYSWKRRPISKRALENKFLTAKIKLIFDNNRCVYGSRRIHAKLMSYGIRVSRKRVAKLMKLSNIIPKYKRKFRITTNSNHKLVVAPNLVKQDFTITKPNKVWAGDITYIKTKAGWLYLASVMDLYSRKIVGWSMDKSMTADLVNNAINMAIMTRKPKQGLIWHTDRGAQYCAKSHRNILKSYGIVQSMSRKGNCWDNATSESFFSTLKRETYDLHNAKNHNDAAVKIFDYIEAFYNKNRLHSTIGYKSPHDFEIASNLIQ